MEISPYLLFLLLVYSFAWGLILGGIYDGFLFLRMLFGEFATTTKITAQYEKKPRPWNKPIKRLTFLAHKRIRNSVVFTLDSVLLLISGCGIAVLCYHFNHGQFRVFSLLSCLSGFLFYRISIGRIVFFLFQKLIFLFYMFLSVFLDWISRPFVIFARIFTFFLKKLYISFLFSIAKIKELLYNKSRKKELLKKARKGFLISFALGELPE